MNYLFYIRALIWIILQGIVFKTFTLFGIAMCFPYVWILYSAKPQYNRNILLFLAFIIGFIVDVFYDTYGIHALSYSFIVFLRPYWLVINTPFGGFENYEHLSFKETGILWQLRYLLPMLLLHHYLLFTLESWRIFPTWFMIQSIFFSTIYSFVIIVLMQLFFDNQARQL